MELPIDTTIELPQEICAKWQRLMNLMTESTGATAAVVYRHSHPMLEIICISDIQQSPYQPGDKKNLDKNYGKQIIETREPYYIADATKIKKWKNNPDIKHGYTRFLGLPISWPNGEFFGFLAFYGDESHTIDYPQSIYHLQQEMIENQLAAFYQQLQLKNKQKEMEALLDTIDEGILYHSFDRQIGLFNKAAERITGISRNQALYKDCHKVFPYKLCGANCSFCEIPLQFDGIKTYETVIPGKKGQKSIKMTIKALVDDTGIQHGVVASLVEYNKKDTHKYLQDSFCGIIGRNSKMLQVYDSINDVAHSDEPVVVLGASGTGKELVAKAIHNTSNRRSRSFIAVNCGAFSQGVIDSELFGHVKGAFTGAIKDKKGCFERAQGGTLFLDEVAELPKETQVKLLRVLQEKTYEPVGGEKTKNANVRIISATNRDLKYMVDKGEFREDLYYRLAVFPIAIPALRERINDMELLVEYFLECFAKKLSLPHASITREALELLKRYRWPGNIRQLQNAIHYSLIKSKKGIISQEILPPEVLHSVSSNTTKRVGRKQKLNRSDVIATLEKVDGNKAKCARLLGVGRATLYNFLKKEKIDYA